MKVPVPFFSEKRLATPHEKRDLNRDIFTVVAPRYQWITRLLSCFRDQGWKRRMVHILPARKAPLCLDVACGTGDITLYLAEKYPDGRIIGIDITESMLAVARQRQPPPHIEYRCCDMEDTGLAPCSVDIITGGYALRNAGDLHAALAELFRVLKPGGHAAFLDFSKTQAPLLQNLEYIVLSFWGGFWGLLFHGNPSVYTYIAQSLRAFPDRQQLNALIRGHGFVTQRSEPYFFGIIQILTVVKPTVPQTPREAR